MCIRDRHRVRVHPKLSRKILRWRQSLSGAGLATKNGPTNLCRDLLKDLRRISPIDPHS